MCCCTLERSVEEVTRPVSTIRRPRGSSSEATREGRGGMGGDEPTSEYEQKRLANIERNTQMLISLGIVSSPLSPPLSFSGVTEARAGAGTRAWPLRKGCRERTAGGSKRERGGGGDGGGFISTRGGGGAEGGGGGGGIGDFRSRCATHAHARTRARARAHTHTHIHRQAHTHTHTLSHTYSSGGVKGMRTRSRAFQGPRYVECVLCRMCSQ